MDIQITQPELDALTSRALVPIACKQCNTIFHKRKKEILECKKANVATAYHFCSRTCRAIANPTTQLVDCKQCSKSFYKKNTEILKSPNHFCSQSCGAVYNNAHKTTGYRRSSYETYLEQQLTAKGITVINNGKVHGYELDLYLPQYNLAIEVSGIVHYKPIYGQDKLDKIQFRDKMKLEMCNNTGINLVVFDVSKYQNFKYNKHNCDAFLDHLLGAYC